jgi:hypothetical protein
MEQVTNERSAWEHIRGDVKIEWAALGEGWDGDYTGEEDDQELLRFDVYVRGSQLIEAHWAEGEMGDGEWRFVPKSSYCTAFPAETTPEVRAAGLRYLMDRIYPEAAEGHSISRLCQELSWIEPAWLTTKPEQLLESNTK